MENYEQKSYIGIDVSKMFLDVYVFPFKKHMRFKNTPKEVDKLTVKLKLFSPALIAMEATGGYEKLVSKTLTRSQLPTAVVNPRRVRDFAKAKGILAKTDKIDAAVIALFAEKMQPKINIVYDENQEKLQGINTRRRQLVDMLTMEKNRLDVVNKELKKSLNRIIKVLQKELDEINNALEKAIKNDPTAEQKSKLLKTIKGVGDVVSATVIADLPELGTLSAKEITALVGLAPYNRDSGTFRGKRTIWGGRGSVRTMLYMATLASIRRNIQLKEFYTRLCHSGKAKKVAMVACMRKLLIVMNSMLKNNEPWRYSDVVLN